MSAGDPNREFDIVLYGATGFVGKLTAEYLAKAGGDARIALAGRSRDKLVAVRQSLGERAADWPLIEADATQRGQVTDAVHGVDTVGDEATLIGVDGLAAGRPERPYVRRQ